ncbi:MAG: sulfatase [Blastopirellula sp.]|nr:MAG: sulfatase [Blastopirellula sp.]
MNLPIELSRRQMLQSAGAGFGMLGLTGALQAEDSLGPTNLSGGLHHAAKAKRVIFLFMNGAPSHVDTFDPKPKLAEHEGEVPEGRNRAAGYMPSPFKFAPQGESGLVMSELFPNLAKRADDLCVIRSMHTNVPNHEPGLLIMHSGHQQPTRPCLGSWASYGLGSENKNLPSFVVLCPGLPVVGPQLWNSSFLPGEHQGTVVDTNNLAVDKLIANLNHPRLSRDQQRHQLNLLNQINKLHAAKRAEDERLEAQINAMQLAFNMQKEASEAFDLNLEPEKVRDEYGRSVFGQSCLLARRLAERDVRFIQVYYVSKSGKQPWDTHTNNNEKHKTLCADSDKATAALLTDLKQRGLLEDTLVVWGGEFGRTPYAQMNKDKKNAKLGRRSRIDCLA